MAIPSVAGEAFPQPDPLGVPALLRSTALILILSVLTLLMGFAVQVVLAAKLGTSPEMDAYFVAITLPTAITMISLVTFAPVMVPVLKQRLSFGGMREARDTFTQVHNLVGLLMLPVVGVIILGAGPVIRLAAPGFDPQTVELAAGLLQIMIIGAFFDTLRGLQSAFYYSQERFFLPQFVPIVNHFIILLSVLFLLDRVGLPGLALGWTAGSLAMFVLLFIGPVRGPRIRLKFDLKDPGLRQVGVLLFPAAMVALLSQATPFVDRLVASLLPSGSISYLGYGSKMLEILMRTVPMGVGLAVFPIISDHAARRDWGKLNETITTALRWTVLGSLPIATVVVLLRESLVALAFQRGAFDEVATAGVAEALAWYALALIPASLIYIFHRVFYALQDPWTLMRVGGLGLVGTIFLDIALSRLLGFSGIAIAFLSISVVLAIAMAIIVKGRFLAFPASRIVWVTGQATVAALVMGEAMAGLGWLVGTGSEGSAALALYVMGSLLLGTGAYLLVLRILGNPEVRSGEAILKERAGRWLQKAWARSAGSPRLKD